MRTNRFMPGFRTPGELEDLQLKGLQWTVSHAFNGSPTYRKKLSEAGVSPGDIQSLCDLQRLPFTTADDVREGYPFPLLCVPFEEVVRIHVSSGTTGNKKVLCYSRKDIDDWAHFFARCFEMAELTAERPGPDRGRLRRVDRRSRFSTGL